jgi:glutamate-1-semialdehyde 2,1-aminomutase
MTQSEDLYRRACAVMPGGVNSPVRAFRSVEGTPIFFDRAAGARFTDVDGRSYLDLQMSWGPLILGHAHPAVLDAVMSAAARGLSFGACHPAEAELCEAILRGFPGMERVRLMNSGTEAVMTAVRLARGATGRPLLIKFEGGYHGHLDAALVKAGSGLVTHGIATSAGVPASVASATLVAPFADLDAVEELFRANPGQIAAVLLEPMPANNGLLLQTPAYLAGLRRLCTEHGALLIFDEVISGFRLQYGGYGGLVGVQPDLVTLGKIVGGGMPIGAVVGPGRIVDLLAPLGPVYQAGTLSGNPVSVAAGLATMRHLSDPAVYARLDALGARLEAGLTARGVTVVRQGSIVWPYLGDGPIPVRADTIDPQIGPRFAGLHRRMLELGVYLPPSAYEVWFLSSAHTDDDVDAVLAAWDQARVDAR